MQCPVYSIYGGQRTALNTSVTAEAVTPQGSPHIASALVKTLDLDIICQLNYGYVSKLPLSHVDVGNSPNLI